MYSIKAFEEDLGDGEELASVAAHGTQFPRTTLVVLGNRVPCPISEGPYNHFGQLLAFWAMLLTGWLLPALPGAPFLWLLLGPGFVSVIVGIFYLFICGRGPLWPHWPLRWLLPLFRVGSTMFLALAFEWFLLHSLLIGILAVWQFFGALLVWLVGLCCFFVFMSLLVPYGPQASLPYIWPTRL